MGSPRMKAKMAMKKTCSRQVASALTIYLGSAADPPKTMQPLLSVRLRAASRCSHSVHLQRHAQCQASARL